MPEKIDIMNEVWKILLDWMRKQASQVLLLTVKALPMVGHCTTKV